MKTLIAMALMVTSVAVMGDEVKEVKVEESKAEVVTVPVEAIPSLTAEQIKEILRRDEERAKWIKKRKLVQLFLKFIHSIIIQCL